MTTGLTSDQIEAIAADVAGYLATEALRHAGVRIPPAAVAMIAAAARYRLRGAIARASALRVDASTASFADLRKR